LTLRRAEACTAMVFVGPTSVDMQIPFPLTRSHKGFPAGGKKR